MRVPMLGEISDGRAAWAEFFTGLQDTLDRNAEALPVIGIVFVVLLVVWLDVRLARWLIGGRRGDHDKSAESG